MQEDMTEGTRLMLMITIMMGTNVFFGKPSYQESGDVTMIIHTHSTRFLFEIYLTDPLPLLWEV